MVADRHAQLAKAGLDQWQESRLSSLVVLVRAEHGHDH